MVPASKPLLSLTAMELMSPMVVTVPQDMSLQGAAHLLAQADVSGAPVVDANGCCVGVISARDFVGWADRGEQSAKRGAGPTECFCSAWQLLATESLPREVVSNYMTADPVTVSPGTLIGTMARMMVDARIHRLIVLDQTGRPVGVVSSTDVLAAVARAARARDDADAVLSAASEETHDDPFYPRTP
jgi:CBS-domain-containing membrane protein